MIKKTIIIASFILVISSLCIKTLAQKLSINIFSQIKQDKEKLHIPPKSDFETSKEYQNKINSIKTLRTSITLEIPLMRVGKYDAEAQELTILLRGTSVDFNYLPKIDKYIANQNYFGGSGIIFEYRNDLGTKVQQNVICVNGLGQKFKYRHEILQATRYLIQGSDKTKIDSILSLRMSPEKAKQYFSGDERFLNNRLAAKIVARPQIPFYSFFSSTEGEACPNSPISRALSNYDGITNTFLFKNHLIYVFIDTFEVFDKATGETIFSQSFPIQ
jgi:hypothetical protein